VTTEWVIRLPGIVQVSLRYAEPVLVPVHLRDASCECYETINHHFERLTALIRIWNHLGRTSARGSKTNSCPDSSAIKIASTTGPSAPDFTEAANISRKDLIAAVRASSAVSNSDPSSSSMRPAPPSDVKEIAGHQRSK
jgi:hypothetical protein